MKTKQKKESTILAEAAMKRAARNVLSTAVQNHEPIPLWNGKEVVWKIPTEEAEQLAAQDTPPSRL